MSQFAVVTVVTSNYLHFALALAASLRQQHQDIPLFICLADQPPQLRDPLGPHCQLVPAEHLGIPQWRRFAFQYTAFELTCALKPFAIQWVLNQGYQKVIYADADIQFYNRLDGIVQQLDSAHLILTPHLHQPLPRDGCLPNQRGIDQAGIFNAGFLAFRAAAASEMLSSWQQHVAKDCIVDPENRLFVDQRWLDTVPQRFPPVHITREPGYNVGYWNLPQRRLHRSSGGQLLVNNRPLYFYHFSGWDPQRPWVLSRHQNRVQLGRSPVVRALLSDYGERLEACGRSKYSPWSYRHARLSNGCLIPPRWREAIRTNHPLLREIEDPFDVDATPDLMRLLDLAAADCRSNRSERGKLRSLPGRLMRHSRTAWCRAIENMTRLTPTQRRAA